MVFTLISQRHPVSSQIQLILVNNVKVEPCFLSLSPTDCLHVIGITDASHICKSSDTMLIALEEVSLVSIVDLEVPVEVDEVTRCKRSISNVILCGYLVLSIIVASVIAKLVASIVVTTMMRLSTSQCFNLFAEVITHMLIQFLTATHNRTISRNLVNVLENLID